MEVVTKPVGASIDAMAEQVFAESIALLGGLRKLVEYRNLTWLPSLAEAAYVVVLKNEAMKSYAEIARELGITEQTARSIATAKEEKVEAYLTGEVEKPKEHIAGGLAKLAYRKLKQEGRLGGEVRIAQREAEVLGIDWAVHVLAKIKGLDFPAEREQLAERLRGVVIKGKRAEEILVELEYPVKTPAELLHKLRERL
ncbi:KaiC associated regulatory domain-containing protein [Candidatus Pyrohabitans sp.]